MCPPVPPAQASMLVSELMVKVVMAYGRRPEGRMRGMVVRGFRIRSLGIVGYRQHVVLLSVLRINTPGRRMLSPNCK